MKRLSFISILFGISVIVAAQCIPDTNCIDVEAPGQICPDTLAGAIVGENYSQPVTIVAPDSAFLGTTGTTGTKILKIVLDTITNLPPGITYSSETKTFYPDSIYCVLLSGTPTDTGTFYLDISVIPYIPWGNSSIALGAQHDTTSMFITVSLSSYLPETMSDDFSLITGHPNPFRTFTKIGFFMRNPQKTELAVFDLAGKMIYQETVTGKPGENYFMFSGRELAPGVYPYTVAIKRKQIAGKLVKLR